MKATEFCYWLQGALEILDPETFTPAQLETIKRHLNMVFVHDIDPSYPSGQQAALNAIHTSLLPKEDKKSNEPRPRC